MCSDLLCVRSHLDKTTTWHDPRVPQLQSAASQHPIANTPVHAHSLSNPAATTQAQNSINPEPGIILSSPTIHPPTQNPPPRSQRPASLESTELLDRVQSHSLQSHSLCLPRMSLLLHLNSFVGCYHTCILAKPCDENDSRYI